MHMAQLMPLPLTVSCFSKIQIGFTFLVPAHPDSPKNRAVKWVCVCVCVWTLYRKHIKQLEQFHMCCLRKIAGIRWQDRVSNTRVLEMCGISGIEAFLQQSQFHWVGHIVRMPNFRILKQAFFGQLASGCRLHRWSCPMLQRRP